MPSDRHEHVPAPDRAPVDSDRADASHDTFAHAPLERIESAPSRMRDRWRWGLGLLLLFTTVILWTASNFLASTIFADNTYSKPFLVTYINTAVFILPLFPMILRQLFTDPRSIKTSARAFGSWLASYRPLGRRSQEEQEAGLKPDSPSLVSSRPPHDRHRRSISSSSTGPDTSRTTLLLPPSAPSTHSIFSSKPDTNHHLTLAQTARLSLEFSLLWFLANYFVAACLEYTTVASSTILTSTSSVFTLLFGVLFRVEAFTLRLLAGVLASLAGIVLISTVDLSGSSDHNRGSFPHKTTQEIALGDLMALISALLYGVYAVLMKKRIRDETRVHMPLFFGLVGVFNVLLLWPGLVLLHLADVERFELPPAPRVTAIVLVNAASSLVADYAWAYAVLLTSPIVVTVGLSTTIPLSLVGQLVINDQRADLVYWLGALVVVASFVVVSRAEKEAGSETEEGDEEMRASRAALLGSGSEDGEGV